MDNESSVQDEDVLKYSGPFSITDSGVSTEIPMGFALLDNEFSNHSLFVFGTKMDAIRHLDNCLRPSGLLMEEIYTV